MARSSRHPDPPPSRRELFGPWTPHGFSPRPVRVYVPRGFDDGVARPLLVMFDGQNIFDDATSFAGSWRLGHALDRLARDRPIPVVAAVDHGNHERLAELSPWSVGGREGRAEAFLHALLHDLVPRLQHTFRTVPGPHGLALGGSSLGGLAALFGHLRFPEHVGGALALSPSLWVGGGELLRFAAARSRPWTSRIYVDAGHLEGRGRSLARAVEELGGVLRAKGYDGGQLHVRVDPRGAHDERAWRRRVPAALRFVYRNTH
jgi:enterochelin esterase-like enzyme